MGPVNIGECPELTTLKTEAEMFAMAKENTVSRFSNGTKHDHPGDFFVNSHSLSLQTDRSRFQLVSFSSDPSEDYVPFGTSLFK